jgi:hypothetical protein
MALSTACPVGVRVANLTVLIISRLCVELLTAHAHVPGLALVLAQVIQQLVAPLERCVAEVALVDQVIVFYFDVAVQSGAAEERLGAVRARYQGGNRDPHVRGGPSPRQGQGGLRLQAAIERCVARVPRSTKRLSIV